MDPTLSHARKILLCARRGIGDLIMEIPLMQALRKAIPYAHVSVLGARPALQVLENHSPFDQLFYLEDFGVTDWADAGTEALASRFGRWLDDQRFDVVVDALQAPMAIRDSIYGRQMPVRDLDQEAIRGMLRCGKSGLDALRAGAIDGWGIPVEGVLAPRLKLDRDELEAGRRYLEERGVCQRPRVAVSPIASSEAKRWPLAHVAAAADYLLDSHRGRLPIFFGPDDQALRDELLCLMRRADDVVPIEAQHLRLTAAMLVHCDLLLANDTGLMHLSAAVGTPVVAIFGPTSPGIYLPPNCVSVSGNRTACPHASRDSFSQGSCVQSGHCSRPTASCMARIPLAAVLAALHTHLERETAVFATVETGTIVNGKTEIH